VSYPRTDQRRRLNIAYGLGVVVLVALSGETTSRVSGQEVDTQRETEFSRQYFLRALVAKNSETRATAIARIEREFAEDSRASAVITEVLDRIREDPRERPTTFQLIHLLKHFSQQEVERYLLDLLQSSDHRTVMTALESLTHQQRPETLESILSLAERPEFDSHYGFRVSVLEAVMGYQSPTGIDFLVQQLPDLRGQSAAIVVEYLSRASGQSLGFDPEGWRTWWKQVDRQAFRFGGNAEPDALAGGISDSDKPQFFGQEISAERLVFVIDKSGSMSAQLRPGEQQTRLVRAQQELAKAIAKLPVGSHFNIVAFDGNVARWQPRLVQATPEHKASATRFVAMIAAGGQTASFDALTNAFALDPNLEAIYFLSDGAPTIGRVVSSPEIVHAISSENYFRRISIHTVGIGVSGLTEQFLRALAQHNRGGYRAIGNAAVDLAAAPPQRRDAPQFQPEQVFSPPMPPIQKPRALKAATATKRLKGDELVLGITLEGEARAYPLNMLTGPNREIINDELGGHPIAATWCHLAHCATVYDRRVEDQSLTLVVSGLLWNDTLVIMDSNTGSLWGQLDGKARHGTLQGKTLKRLSSVVTDWASWHESHPETTVTMLSRTTQVFGQYTYNNLSDFVIGAEAGQSARAWAFDALIHQPAVNDKLGEEPVLVTFQAKTRTATIYRRTVEGRSLSFHYEEGRLTDEETSSVWNLATGHAVAGPLRGTSLSPLPSTVAYRKNWEAFFPTTTFWSE